MRENNFEKQLIESEKLDEIKPLDYFNLESDLKEWLEIKEDLPREFWEKIRDANEEENLKLMLLRIKEELLASYGNKKDKGRSFEDSRFTSLEDMLERGMVSCGAMAKIIGTILRKFGIPTKMINGILESQRKSFIKNVLLKNRHSWLEIYVPKTKEWLPLDPTRHDFSVYPDAIKTEECHDWDELRGGGAKK